MSIPVQRMGDPNNAGGVVTTIPQGTVWVNDRLVCVDGSKGTGHAPFEPPHLSHQWLTSASSTVTAEDIQINKDGDVDSCGHVRVNGSSDVETG